MKLSKHILLFPVLFWINFLSAQPGHESLPHSNRYLLNPSFAGLNKYQNTWAGMQYYSESKYITNSLFSFSYDKYSEILKGGLGFSFQQAIHGERNILKSETGISYSGFNFELGKGKIIPSVSASLAIATKQWFVFAIDKLLAKELEPPSAPGEDFTRYSVFKPGIGLLYDSKLAQIGLTFATPFQKNMLQNETETGENLERISPYYLIMYFAMKKHGNRNGLVSTPFKMYPEVVLYYHENMVMTRTGLKIEHVDQTLGLYIENNFLKQVHQVGGIYGWRFNHVKINLAAGIYVPKISEKTVFSGEITLGLTVPPVLFEEKKPWAPEKKLD